MKHFTTTVLLCGAAILGASGQNIIVTDKDGVAHKFNADYVKEITFERIQSQGDAVNLDIASVAVNPYNLTNIELILEAENGDMLDLDLTQPSTMWLSAGNYVVSGSDGYTIDPGWSYAIIGGEKKDVQSGSLDVKLDGEEYTFNADFVVGENVNVKGTFTGKLPKFGPTANYDLTGVSYVEVNEPAPNGFYYRFNDENWRLEMRIDLFSEGDAAPKPGTYSFSESTDNGCAGSYVNLYAPYNDTTSFKEGTVTVEEDGENTIVKINGVLANGLPMTASFSGKLPARPSVAQDIDLNVISVEVNPYNLTNIELILEAENGDKLDLDLTQPSTMWLSAGNYVVSGSDGYTIDPGWSYAIIGGEKKDVQSGSLEVKLDNEVYTFNADFVVGENVNVKGTFTGKLPKFGPTANYDLTGVSYVEVNEPAPNGFYYRFNDENWRLEMRIDLFSEGDAAPKPGTYSFSESTDNGCAGSYVNLYAPYNDTTSFKEGTVTVEEDGENTIVKINGVLANGLPMTASFSGKLPARTAE